MQSSPKPRNLETAWRPPPPPATPMLGELICATLARPEIKYVVRGASTRSRSKYLPHMGAKERAKLDARKPATVVFP